MSDKRKTRRYGQHDVQRTVVTVSVNDFDHPLLYDAIVNNNMPLQARKRFTSTSAFLALAGNAALKEADKDDNLLKEIILKLEDLAGKIENMKLVSAEDPDLDEVYIDLD